MVHVVNPGASLSFDYNLYFNPGGTYNFWWESPSLTGYWASLSAWQTGAGQDLQAIAYKDPLLDTANTYRALPGSPAIDSGTAVSGIAVDYAGTTRPQGAAFDRGAFEFAVQPVVPSLLTATGGSNQTAAPLQSFANPLSAKVSDSTGKGVAGIPVTFTAPANGTSVTFNGSHTATVVTGADGVATSPAMVASQPVGTFTVTATAPKLNYVFYPLSIRPARRTN
jgi:hypothetical protein